MRGTTQRRLQPLSPHTSGTWEIQRRGTTILLLGTLLLAGGCRYFTETNPPPRWSEGQLKKLQEENRRRLAGERETRLTVGGAITYIPNTAYQATESAIRFISGDRPIKYAKELFHKNADIRRQAVFELADHEFGRQEPYTQYYRTMAERDSDPTVRAAAVRALNRSRDTGAIAVFINALGDANQFVRLEAAKALANIPDPMAINALVKTLSDDRESRDVRIAAADALRLYPRSDVAQALIRVLDTPDFAVAWQARRSLNLLTGQDFRYDQAAWLTHLARSDKPFAA